MISYSLIINIIINNIPLQTVYCLARSYIIHPLINSFFITWLIQNFIIFLLSFWPLDLLGDLWVHALIVGWFALFFDEDFGRSFGSVARGTVVSLKVECLLFHAWHGNWLVEGHAVCRIGNRWLTRQVVDYDHVLCVEVLG